MKRLARRRDLAAIFAAALLALAAAPAALRAQDDDGPAPMGAPDLAAALRQTLDAEFLRPDERAELRILHGVAQPQDLTTPARRARWALLRGAYADAALRDEAADVLDRAAGALERGEPEAALALLEAGLPAPVAPDRAQRLAELRVRGLELLGRIDEMVIEAGPSAALLDAAEIPPDPAAGAGAGAGAGADTDQRDRAWADAVVAAVRTRGVVLRHRPGQGAAGDEHRRMMRALAAARRADPQNPGVPLAEAALLHEKDNAPAAQKALEEALSLCPASAQAWALLGRMAVDAFDMSSAESIAQRLEVNAGDGAGDGAGAGAGAGAEAGADAAAGAGVVVSPEAAALRARAMLRQNDGPRALEALRAARAAFPQREEPLLLAAAAHAVRLETEEAAALIDAHEARAPGSARARAEVGKALAEARQYGRASAMLEEACRRAPHWSVPRLELGLLHMQSGRDAEALDALEIATAMDPFNVRAENSLRLQRRLAGFARVESANFIVRAQGPAAGPGGAGPGGAGPGGTGGAGVAGDAAAAGVGDSPDTFLAREMLPVLEELHAAVTGAGGDGLDHVPAQKTVIDLMPDHRSFAVRIVGMPRIHTIAASTGPVIAMEAPREGPGHTGTYDWPRVLRHEYVHTVGLSRTDNRLPHWFTEAQAVHLEGGPRAEATCRLLADALGADGLFDFERINLAFVRPRRPTDRALAYAQGSWMYEYLVRTFGSAAPLALMDRFRAGVVEEDAYAEVLGVSREEFMSNFRAWAGDQVTAWGLRPPAGVPTVRELLERAAGAAAAGAGAGGVEGRAVEPTPERVEAWLAEYPDHPELLELAVGHTLERTGGVPSEEMLPMLRRWAAAAPVVGEPRRLMLRVLLPRAEAGETEAARGALAALAWLDEREEKSASYSVQRAVLHAMLGELAEAGAAAERATRLSPYDARHRELAAGLALRRGDPAGAQRHIEMLVLLEPDRPIHAQRLEAVKRRRAGAGG